MRTLRLSAWLMALAAVWVACGSSDEARTARAGEGGEAGAAGDGNEAAEGGRDARGGDAGNGAARNGDAGAATPPSDAGRPGDGGASPAAGGSGEAGGGVGGGAGASPVEVAVIKHFNVGARLCGLGFDSGAQRVWAHPCFGAEVLSFSPEGVAGPTIAAPGEGADDVDVAFTPQAITLGQQLLSTQTALFFNGELDTLDIYALDSSGETATPIATLATAFGNSHVVGGGFHAQRGTFFAVQDRVPGAELGNVVAELNPVTGAIVNQFSLLPSFEVNYGDLEICQSTGHLFMVSSVENVVAEFEATGALITKYPAEVAGLSGIALDDSTGEVWVAAPAGDVWQLGGLPCPPFGGEE